VLPNDAVVNGKTLAEWSAEWWQWLLIIPTNQNPVFDVDGSMAQVAQPDAPVFFLAGVVKISGTVTRTITIPEGKFLFFPILNVEADNADVVPPLSVGELRDETSAFFALTSELHASIDDIPVPDLFAHRVLSPVFSIDFQSEDNLFTYELGHPFTGLLDPVVSDGYWLMLEPLPAGKHVVHYGGTVGPPVNFTLDILDIITVVPVPLTQQVDELVGKARQSNLATNRLQPLLASLNAARASFASENLEPGINQLNAFQNKVRAQVAPSDPALADQLLQAAQRIIDNAAAKLP
jgi:hypothetical protein